MPHHTWRYDGHRGRAGGPHPRIALVLLHLQNADDTGRSLGIMPSPEHSARNPRSIHEDGRALDWKPTDARAGDRLFFWLAVRWEELTVQLILWRQFQFGGRAGPLLTHTGRQDHNTHLHIETTL